MRKLAPYSATAWDENGEVGVWLGRLLQAHLWKNSILGILRIVHGGTDAIHAMERVLAYSSKPLGGGDDCVRGNRTGSVTRKGAIQRSESSSAWPEVEWTTIVLRVGNYALVETYL